MSYIIVFTRRLLIGLFYLSIAGAASLAAATNVRFVGSVGYSANGVSVILTADQVHNAGVTGSDQLRLELWATPTPFTGSFASGHLMGQYSLGTLPAGGSLNMISSGAVPFFSPPSGSWYVAMVLTEYTGAATNGGYTVADHLNFATQLIIGPPPTDTTPPTVSIASPTGGNVSGTVTISANASDNVGVSRVDFYVNGSLKGSDNAAPYQYSWNTTSLANGAATLRAVAFDAAGNSTQSSLVSVTVANAVTPPPDTTPPSVSIASPTGGSVSGTVVISANASDNVGVTHVDLLVNGVAAGSDNSAPYQFSWNTTSLANGAATLRAVAFDAAGNSTQSSLVSVTVANAVTPPPDTTPPTVSIASPTGGNVSGTVAISANASDNVGVTHVDLLVNGQSAGSATSAPYQFSWNSTGVANGAAQLKAVAYDAAGNLAQSAIVTVSVANGQTPPSDTTPPMIPVFLPGGGTVTGLVTLTATASDNVGVSRVDFYANGELVGSDTSAPYHATWDSRNVADGMAILMAVAFDAAGNSGASAPVHVTIANILTPIAPSAYAIEYYNAALDHYFISASAPDINALDSGQFAGWSRTGYVFKVYMQPTGNASPVCRFYLPPIVGDSHFYSASSVECSEVRARFPLFILESENVFYVNLSDAVTGACPASTVPVYRVWNNRLDSNHRYMTDPALREQMVVKGYIAEGYGPDIVIMCAPM